MMELDKPDMKQMCNLSDGIYINSRLYKFHLS